MLENTNTQPPNDLSIEICSTANPEIDAWEKALDAVTDSFLYLLRQRFSANKRSAKGGKDDGTA